jgi:hypothetical protein
LRNSSRALQDGQLEIIENSELLVYKRILEDEVYTVVINFNHLGTSYLSEIESEMVFATNKLNKWKGKRLRLAPNSGCILKG